MDWNESKMEKVQELIMILGEKKKPNWTLLGVAKATNSRLKFNKQ